MAVKKSTYVPEPPDKYKGEQVVFSSGRVLLNAKSDSVLIFAKEAVALSSAGTLNFDSDGKCIIGSPQIYLGLNATEPLLLGNTSVKWLKDLLDKLNQLSIALSKMTKNVGGNDVPHAEINVPAQDLVKTIEDLNSRINSLKSKNNFTT
ncbi:MAG: hypothetical protein AABY22_35715 [Nanoarchaeota archaeon]